MTFAKKESKRIAVRLLAGGVGLIGSRRTRPVLSS
jgi:hypothetical protein